MAEAVSTRAGVIALLGNPNTGKSTIFNALCGSRQRVGNFPGVTVEKKLGFVEVEGRRLQIIDLPGTYSLAPRSPDEMLTVEVLLGRRDDCPAPDAALCIVDASNLERNLYLVSQVLETGLPTVVALNMTDVAETRGMRIDVAGLSRRLGVPVVPLVAHRRQGVAELRAALAEAIESGSVERESPFPEAFQQEVAQLATRIGAPTHPSWPRYLVERLLLDTSGFLAGSLPRNGTDLASELTAARDRLAKANCPVPAIEAISRYGWAGRMLEGVVERPAARPKTFSDRLDRVLTHKLWGVLFFVAAMIVVFQAVFRWATPAMDLLDGSVAWLGDLVREAMPPGPLADLLVDGVLAGFGSVIVFLPQICLLFLFIAVLEDCGYMARAAFLMDKLMVRVGLSGKSFIPLLSSFACAIPGIMATRTIENRRDRLTTILIAPLMSCSARLPVYTILIAAFIPAGGWLGGWLGWQGLTLFAMYALGALTAVVVALILKRTLLRGPTPPFIMELPGYKWPSPRVVLYRVVDRAWSFVRRAGTLIVAVSVLVWAALYFPRASTEIEQRFGPRRLELETRLAEAADDAARAELTAELAQLEIAEVGFQQRQSYLGRAGRLIEPVVRPLGWDWRIGCAVLASFPAREVVVATLGVIYDVGGDVDLADREQAGALAGALRSARWDGTDRAVFNVPVALGLMAFFALCAQCAPTLVVVRREANSWGWAAFTFLYMTALAYLAALVVYQIGSRLT